MYFPKSKVQLPVLTKNLEYFASQTDNVCPLQLQIMFTAMVEELFGLNGKVGFGLHEIRHHTQPQEYDLLFKFLHPLGPFFKVAYKLTFESSLVMEFPLSDLPVAMQQEVQNKTCSMFYLRKLNMDPFTIYPRSLALNPVEYYLYYFIVHLINVKGKSETKTYSALGRNNDCPQKATVYLRLCEEYINAFLPCDGSPIRPVLNSSSTISKSRTVCFSPFQLAESAQMKPIVTGPRIPTHRCHDELWRSYIFAYVAIDFWMSVPNQPIRLRVEKKRRHNIRECMFTTWLADVAQDSLIDPFNVCPSPRDCEYEKLPSMDTVLAVRYLLKHLHTYCFSPYNQSSKLEEFKRQVTSSLQARIYTFLKNALLHWPNDSTFTLLVQTWLTYIQPWCSLQSISEELIDRKWMQFIGENLLFYTYLFQIVISRVSKMHYPLVRSNLVLLKPLKAFRRGDLYKLVEEVETYFMRGEDFLRNQFIYSIKQNIINHEGQEFEYKPIFSEEFVKEIMPLLGRVREIQKVIVSSSTPPLHTKLHRFGWFSEIRLWSLIIDKSDENKDDYDKLERILQLFTEIFRISIEEIEEHLNLLDKPGRTKSSILSSSGPSSSSNFRDSSSSHLNNSIRERSIQDFDYTGDEDLLPIQDYEIGCLVRVFFKLTVYINTQLGEFFQGMYNCNGIIGHIFKVLLKDPKEISYLDKSQGTHRYLRVTENLPPRVSLRFLAHRLFYIYSSILLIICFVFGIPLSKMFFSILLVFVMGTMCVALFKYINSDVLGPR